MYPPLLREDSDSIPEYGGIDNELAKQRLPSESSILFWYYAKEIFRTAMSVGIVVFVAGLTIYAIYYGSEWLHNRRDSPIQSRNVYYSGYLAGKNCTSYVCGAQPAAKKLKIVGGQTSEPYHWPWQGAMFEVKQGETGKTSKYGFLCGATLISDQWAVTAAHCLNASDQSLGYMLKLGVFKEEDFQEPGEIVVVVESIVVHPLFDRSLMYYDLALLKFSEPVVCNAHAYPICLPTQNEDLPPTNSSLTVIGWGKNSETDGSISIYLKQTEVPLVFESICQRIYGTIIDYFYAFCAGYKQGGTDSCQGDSGGPIMYQSGSNQWIQLGITSWGDGCAKPYRPGVYTRISSSIEWILKTMKQ